MMDKINWANYNDDEFVMFCNALLTFELGKTYHPFSAPGKDGGIDGKFQGTYQNRCGNWRFQFKFHKVPNSEGISKLKSQVKQEALKTGSEDFFLLITNLEILPQKQKDIIETFESEVKDNGKKCDCILWDGAKIFNLFIQYPLLLLWLNDGFNTAQLQHYKTAFNKNLIAPDFSPLTFNNYFISPKSYFEALGNFLDSNNNIILITGEAGIGKTRLVIEFFKQKIDSLQDWTPLVLINRNIDFDKIRKALSSKSNYIILVDDAHNFKPEIIADMEALAENLNNKVKLILTARTTEAFNSLSLVKEYDIPNIKLSSLSRADTEEIFNHYLGNTSYKHFTNELVSISHGTPILIVAMLNAMFNGIQIEKIKDQNFIKQYVNKYFNSYIEKVHQSIGSSRSVIKRILQNIVLIEPFNYNDSSIILKLSKLHNIDLPMISEALKLLIDNEFVDGRYEQSIKPDYYSDILLSDIKQKDILTYIKEFDSHIDNIIINLISVDDACRESNIKILDEILIIYVKQIESIENIDEINKILSTILAISTVQPDISKITIELFTSSLFTDSHILNRNFKENLKHKYHSKNAPINKVLAIMCNIYTHLSYLDFVYETSFKLYRFTKDSNFSKVFEFSKKDIIDGFDMVRQNYFIDEVNKQCNKWNEEEFTFCLACIKNFLKLDFSIIEWNAVDRNSLNIKTYFIPSAEKVKKFRQSLTELLIKFFRLPNAQSLKFDILKHIIDIPRGIFASQSNNQTYKNPVEIRIILNFLKREAKSFGLLEQRDTLEKLYWFEQWGIQKSFIPLINEIKLQLSPKNFSERLSQLFSKVEIHISDIVNIEQHIIEQCNDMISNADKEEVASSLVKFLEYQSYIPHYYWSFQNVLESNYPEYAKAFHDKLYYTSFKLYSQFGPKILGSLHFVHHDDTFYWKWIKILQKRNDIESDNALLSIYSYKVPDKDLLTSADIDIIIKVFKKRELKNNYNLAFSLQNLFIVNHAKAIILSKDFLERANQREAEMFFLWLSDNKSVTTQQLADLVLNDTIKHELSYQIEKCLNYLMKIDKKYEEDVFQYLIKRFEYKRLNIINKKSLSNYEFVPTEQRSRLFDENMHNVRSSFFVKAINWYVELKGDYWPLFFAKHLLRYLQPKEVFDSDLANLFNKLILKHREDGDKLSNIIDSLSIFYAKNEILLDTIINGLNMAVEYSGTNTELYKKIRLNCYMAITTMGVKSGTPNMPFQVDLDLQMLLNSFISKTPEYLPANRLLKDVLKEVNAGINSSYDNENETW